MVALALMCIVLFAFQVWINNVQTLPSDFFPARAVGSVAGSRRLRRRRRQHAVHADDRLGRRSLFVHADLHDRGPARAGRHASCSSHCRAGCNPRGSRSPARPVRNGEDGGERNAPDECLHWIAPVCGHAGAGAGHAAVRRVCSRIACALKPELAGVHPRVFVTAERNSRRLRQPRAHHASRGMDRAFWRSCPR